MKPAVPAPPTSRSPAVRLALVKRLVTAAVATFLALVMAELVLRAAHWARLGAAIARIPSEHGRLVAVESDIPELVYTYRPRTAGTNSRGYYDEDHDLEKPPEVFRIVVIGDSVAAGQEVGWPNAFGKLLEHRFNQLAAESCAMATDAHGMGAGRCGAARHERGASPAGDTPTDGGTRADAGTPADTGGTADQVVSANGGAPAGTTVLLGAPAGTSDSRASPAPPAGQREPAAAVDECEVILLARSGYGTSQELVLLEREAFVYRPDLILWSYVLNDPANPLYHDVSGDLRLLYHPRCELEHLGKAAWFRLRELLAAQGGPDEFHARLHHVHRDEIAQRLARIARLCRDHAVPCVLVIHPVLSGKKPLNRYPLSDVHDDLRRLAESAGLRVVDLTPAYGTRLPSQVGYPDDPWHPNALGHELAADDLAVQLVELGLVPWGPALQPRPNRDESLGRGRTAARHYRR